MFVWEQTPSCHFCSVVHDTQILRHHRPDFKINLMIENDASCHLIVRHCKLPYFVSSCIISRGTTDQILMESRQMIHFCTSCQIFKLAHKCYSFSSRRIYKCSTIKGVNMFIVAWLELAKRLKERILWWWWTCVSQGWQSSDLTAKLVQLYFYADKWE